MKIHPAHRKLHTKLRELNQQRQALTPAQIALQDVQLAVKDFFIEKFTTLIDADTIKAAGLYPTELAAIMATSPVIALLTVFRTAQLMPPPAPDQRRRVLLAMLDQVMDFIPQYMETAKKELREQIQFDYEIELSGQPFDINQPCPSPDAN